MTRKIAMALVLLAISFALLYRHVIVKLVHDWATDDNYSHGFLIVPLACLFAWERRTRFRLAVRRPSNFGFLVALSSVALLLAGVLGAESFLTRISILGFLAGTILFLYGWAHLKIMLFPILFLILMIPVPAIIFNQIAFPLQLFASKFGEAGLIACRIPVLREGNIIILSNISLEVAEACSGIRSLISLVALGIVYGYFCDSRLWVRVALAFATIPIAIVTNGIRLAGTGIAAHVYGRGAAEGFFHTFSGWLVFAVAFVMLFLLHKMIRAVFSDQRTDIPFASD
jgi:exosortase